MLSYRHSYHAGNFADILKHFTLYEVLTYLNRKDKPYLYFDTHAGAGLYDLRGYDAQKNQEYLGGISALREHRDTLPDPLRTFLDFLDGSIPKPNAYPGSPWIAAKLLRQHDTLQACELHPSDFPALEHNIQSFRAYRSYFHHADGYQTLLGNLPPAQHRAAILIDPPYEEKSDYDTVLKTLAKAIKRFPLGSYLVWYPLLPRFEAQQFGERLTDLADDTLDYERIELIIKAMPNDGFGMYGCGMMLFNPPYLLPERINALQSAFTQLLGQDTSAHMKHEFRIS